MDIPPTRPPEGSGGRRRGVAGQGEGADPRPRRTGGPAPTDAPDGRREGLSLRRAPCGSGQPARPVQGRRQLIVYRAFYAPDVTTCAPGTSYPERQRGRVT